MARAATGPTPTPPLLKYPPSPSGKVAMGAASRLPSHQFVEFPPGGAETALPWCHSSAGGNSLLLALEVLYSTLCNNCMGSTPVLPAL